MSMSAAMNASVSGLVANSSRLSTISDNIANSQTHGYKRVTTEFSSIFLNQGRAAGLYAAGGVRFESGRVVEEDGALISTTHPLDVAVAGRGMLPVMGRHSDEGSALLMTRTGSFRPDAEGVLTTGSGLTLMGWPLDRDGTMAPPARDSVGQLQKIVLGSNQSYGDPTTTVRLGVNLPADETRPTGGGSYDLPLEYFDNLGASQTLNTTFTPATDDDGDIIANTWVMEIRDMANAAPGGQLVGSYTLEFHNDPNLGGSLKSVTAGDDSAEYDPVLGAVGVQVEGGGTIQVGIGMLNGPGGMTQLSASFAPTNISKDGSPAGQLLAVEIDGQGILRATYDTGHIKALYKIPLVDVPNPNALTGLDNQVYKVSSSSGALYLWDAGDGPTGSVVGYAREGSTVDIAHELTSLIQTQRAYSSNAKIVQTVDEMLQETTNIKR
ncbi:flagellar hook protein FlgE [Paracoccus sp. (in: a-proteobacteria)]|uniref:flagellar hook protein FlgE n=1 Tax=Paracoccus sp. TaxID=267 RepID=UPI0026E0B9D1|nr:flagellar hook-basal body complex protein [Paracoccus sp. (in: a-proteobacteria)]MDO5648460.1 flagellar hook-basal body complex protein [Paracoccus sp. (in: a-proteobacteria)]